MSSLNAKADRTWMIEHARKSQGKDYEFKTGCNLAVTGYFNASDKVKYLHTITDVVRAVRKVGYTVRSRKSSIKKNSSIGSVRKQLESLGEGDYIIRVPGHAMVLNHKGETIIDTSPRKRDARKITHIYKVY